MIQVVGFCKNKVLNWYGFIYKTDFGEKMVLNSGGITYLTPQKENTLELVSVNDANSFIEDIFKNYGKCMCGTDLSIVIQEIFKFLNNNKDMKEKDDSIYAIKEMAVKK